MKIAWDLDIHRAQTLWSGQLDAATFDRELGTECAEHSLGVIARDGRLSHARAATCVQASEQYCGLDLGTGDLERQFDALEMRRALDLYRRQPICGFDARAHPPQRFRYALHWPLHQRSIADQRDVERRTRQQTHKQAHRGSGIAHIERAGGRLQSANTSDAVDDDAAGLLLIDPDAQCAQRAQRCQTVLASQKASDLRQSRSQLRRTAAPDAKSTCRQGL